LRFCSFIVNKSINIINSRILSAICSLQNMFKGNPSSPLFVVSTVSLRNHQDLATASTSTTLCAQLMYSLSASTTKKKQHLNAHLVRRVVIRRSSVQ
jgi:hypothetical protein